MSELSNHNPKKGERKKGEGGRERRRRRRRREGAGGGGSNNTRRTKHTLTNQYGHTALDLKLKSGYPLAPTSEVHFLSLWQKSVKIGIMRKLMFFKWQLKILFSTLHTYLNQLFSEFYTFILNIIL